MGCLFPIEMKIHGKPIQAPCRNCANCRALRKANLDIQYTLELMENYKKGYGATFITLTYNDLNVPIATRDYKEYHMTLNKEHSQKYMQTMRNLIKRSVKEGMRANEKYAYILAGEYGEDPNGTMRPHYHAVIIGVEAEQWATLSKEAWKFGTQKIETLKGTAGISYVTSYFENSINRKEAEKIMQEYGFQAPYITRSRNTAIESIMNNWETWTENGMRYYTRGKNIPLPRNIRERIRKAEGIKYEKTLDEMKQLKKEAETRGFENIRDYNHWKDWIKEYRNVQKSRNAGNCVRSTYTLTTAQKPKIKYIQGEDEV